MRRRILIGVGAAVAVIGALLILVSAVMLRPASLRSRAESELTSRLRLDTTIGDLRVTWLPRPRVSGRDVVLSVPDRPDLPPVVRVARFSAAIGPLSLLRRQIDTVELEGLEIHVPPGGDRQDLPSLKPPADSPILVRHLVSRDAVLRFVPGKADNDPLTFQIHDLAIDNVGFTRAMPFRAQLTNPVPTGLIESTGSIGPWQPGALTALPVSGDFTLTDADLGTINGIGGTLQSSGSFDGVLTEIRATGTATVAGFSLDLGGQPVPLETSYTAIIDGTNGTTRLDHVEALLLTTSIVATGAITNLPGPGNRDVEISSEITNGRIEDMLTLTIDSPEPLLTGDLTSSSTLSLPPGPGPVRDRLTVTGRFGLGNAEFTSDEVQEKVDELSRRSQGQSEEDMVDRVLTNLEGRFALARGVVTLRDLTFEVPGANVAMAGTYDTGNEALDFRGTLRMEATVSEAVGGFKSIFIKPFNFLFRKDGAGAVVPIKITGTWREPKTDVEIGRIVR